MPAHKGNSYWKKRYRNGRKKKYKTSEEIWEAAVEYFEHVENNPMEEEKLCQYKGDLFIGVVNKPRPMTIVGLALYMGIAQQTWYNYAESEGFMDICTRIEGIIRDQKFAGATAGLMNHAIIARDLGLSEKVSVGADPENPLTVLIKEISGNTLSPKND